jgi:hypothetical protein
MVSFTYAPEARLLDLRWNSLASELQLPGE